MGRHRRPGRRGGRRLLHDRDRGHQQRRQCPARQLYAPRGLGHPGPAHHSDGGGHLVGTAGFVFTPDPTFTDTFQISQVTVTCLGTATAASGDGTWQASADTNDCGNGTQNLSTTVTVTDPDDNAQTWYGPTTSVTIANAPQLGSEDAADAYFFPSGDGFSDTTVSA